MQVFRLNQFLLSGCVFAAAGFLFLPTTVDAWPTCVNAWQEDASELIKQLRSDSEVDQSAAADRLGFMPEAAAESVPVLTELLSSPSELVRWRAARALGLLGDDAAAAADALCGCCEDSSDTVKTQVALALGRIGVSSDEAVDALMALVAHEDSSVARSAIAALRNLELDPKVVVDAFAKTLEHDEHAVVIHAVEAMVEGGADAVPVINEVLKNEKIAHWGCIAIESIGADASGALPNLLKLLESSEDSLTRLNGLLAVAAIGDAARSAGGQIAAMFEASKDDTEKAAAIYALGSIGYQGADDQLAAAVASQNQMLAALGAWAGAKLHADDDEKTELAVERLTEALKSDDAQLRSAAARALGELDLPPERVTPALIAIANDPDPSVVENVVDALVTRGPEIAGKAGQALSHPELKDVALAVLERLGPDASDAVPDMIAALDNEEGPFRAKLQLALAAFGPRAKAAAPQLIQSLDASDDKVRSSAMYALGCIGQAAADAAPLLEKKFADSSGFEKLAASWALIMIEPGNTEYASYAIEHLPEGLKNSDPGVRLECIKALGTLGASGKPVLDELRTIAMDDVDEDVRAAAEEAIQLIEDDEG